MANLNIRVDDNLKQQAELIFSDLGISLSAATTMFLKQVVRYNGIPFELRAEIGRASCRERVSWYV